MTRTLYRNGRIFTGDESRWSSALVVDDDAFVHVGTEESAPHADAVVDLHGRVVLPGFTDAHTHLLMMGEALGQVGLTDASSSRRSSAGSAPRARPRPVCSADADGCSMRSPAVSRQRP